MEKAETNGITKMLRLQRINSINTIMGLIIVGIYSLSTYNDSKVKGKEL